MSLSRMAFIMARAPVPREVKRRLSAAIGPEKAANVYKEIFTGEVDRLAEGGLPITIAYDPPHREKDMKELLGEGIPMFPQRGDDLGERILNGFSDMFKKHDRVVAVASDVPDLTADIVREAFDSLDEVDAVVGPCTDGGYYLIGFRRDSFREEAFENIEWGTTKVVHETITRLQGLDVLLLQELRDVDKLSDLEAVGGYTIDRGF